MFQSEITKIRKLTDDIKADNNKESLSFSNLKKKIIRKLTDDITADDNKVLNKKIQPIM